MFKVVDNKVLPPHLSKSYHHNDEISTNNYHLKLLNSNIKQFSIKYKGPILWNSLRPLNNI